MMLTHNEGFLWGFILSHFTCDIPDIHLGISIVLKVSFYFFYVKFNVLFLELVSVWFTNQNNLFFFFYLLLGFGAATSPEMSHFNSAPFKDTFLYFLYCIKLSPLVGSVLLESF